VLKSHRFKTRGDKKSNHVKDWCGLGRVRSLGDFDGLDAPWPQFIRPQVSPTGNGHFSKQKKPNKQK